MRVYARFAALFALLVGLGVASAGYILVQERAPVPFRDTYRVHARFSAADGVLAGSGQPVNVVGVKVGTVAAVQLKDGLADVTFELKRSEVRRVYDNATAFIDPITPLEDEQIELNPGRPPGRPLAPGAAINVKQTSSPVPVGDLLSTLDTDTRNYLSTTLHSLSQGTDGRSADLRRMLVALGPTTGQVRNITVSLTKRRRSLARLVHNLSRVTDAATRDRQLTQVVTAGNATLEAMARQEAPLRAALAKLPGTLSTTESTLAQARPFAQKLGPTLQALQPAVDRLPATYAALRPFADTGTKVLRDDVRPLVREAQPVLSDLAPTVVNVNAALPRLTQSLQATNYFFNELAYNPAGDDEGGLFWASYFFHNWNSLFSTVDAHGGIGRATVLTTCQSIADVKPAQPVLDLARVCPK